MYASTHFSLFVQIQIIRPSVKGFRSICDFIESPTGHLGSTGGAFLLGTGAAHQVAGADWQLSLSIAFRCSNGSS